MPEKDTPTLHEACMLQSLACEEVQGYLVSKPVPAQEMPRLMQKRFLFPPAVQRQKFAPI